MTKHENINEGDKWLISLFSAIAFLLIAAPFTYRFTGSIFSQLGVTIQKDGCPNIWGLIIHAILFALIVRIMMFIPLPGNEGYETGCNEIHISEAAHK